MFGYISELDDAVGKVITTLKERGLYENSVIIFSSDNGAPPAGAICSFLPCSFNLLLFYKKSSSTTNMRLILDGVRGRNWPLKGHKSQLWEGGTKVPTLFWLYSLLTLSTLATTLSLLHSPRCQLSLTPHFFPTDDGPPVPLN